MANIIYGLAGEGFGHSSRSHLIGQNLMKSGHNVTYVTSDRSFRYLKQNFGDKVHEIMGMFLVYKNRNLI